MTHASATPGSTPSSAAARASDSPVPRAADAPRVARSARPPEHTDAALTAYVEKHGTTASAVIRDAVEVYLANV